MKTTIRIKLRALKSVENEGVLVLSVTHSRKTSTATLPYRLFRSEWDEKQECVNLPGEFPGYRVKELEVIQRKLSKDRRSIAKLILQMKDSGSFSAQELVDHFRKKDAQKSLLSFVTKKAAFLKSIGKFGTSRAYLSALKSFMRFRCGQDIYMNHLDSGLLLAFERYLRQRGNSMNTISCYMRSLRAAYNDAISERIIAPRIKNPFSGVFTGNFRTQKRAISKEFIQKINLLELQENQNLTLSRDLFMFSFFAQGMSFIDIIFLKKRDLQDGCIYYSRKKTGQELQVELQECMLQIINRYKSQTRDSVYVFPVLKGEENEETNWNRYQTALFRHNYCLKKIAALSGLNTRLTSYVARHSWATIASREGIPLSVISRGMGHETQKTTEIYISHLDYSDVNRANKLLLSAFNNSLFSRGII